MLDSTNLMSDFYNSSGDEIFICENDGTIIYKNPIATMQYPQLSNLNNLGHILNFDICILNSDDILLYTPVFAALQAKEVFYSSITKQLKSNLFAEYSLFSFPINDIRKVIILRNDMNTNLLEKYGELVKENSLLKEEIAAAGEFKLKLENQLLRANLVNLVAEKVSQYIDTEHIIKITLEQLKITLDIEKAEFFRNTKVSEVKIDDDKTFFAPICHDNELYGTLILYKSNRQTVWQKDEVSLVKGICSLLSTSFAKEELYKKLERQKQDLENALLQLKDAQLKIIQTEKMAALGQLVAGVAHEINTPLAAIMSNLNMLNVYNKKTEASQIKDFINEIAPINAEALKRIDNLIKTLKNFSRLDEAKKKRVDITDGIKSSLALLKHETKGRIEIIEHYEQLPQVLCFPDYINQVFMNILLNACQSIVGKGKIIISTRKKSDSVQIIIADSGVGIRKEDLDKIFDFGYTTKKFGQGTGLGLALAKKILDEHSGKIEVESELEKGTTFTITLPV